jgi:hypothetical protein
LTFQLAPKLRTIVDQVDIYRDDVFSARARSFLQGLKDIEEAQQNLPQIYQPQPTTAASTSTLTPAATLAPAPALPEGLVLEGTPSPLAVDAMVIEDSTTANIGELALLT